MSNESGYLAAIKKSNQERGKKPSASSAPSARQALSVQEKEAARWAAEVAKTDIRSNANLSGARFAVLLKLASASGSASFALEGLTSKELLVERIKKAIAMNEEVLGAYEINNGRPLTVAFDGDVVKFAAGEARSGAKPMSPERMLRVAQVEAAKRAKERPKEKDIMGNGGRGGKR
jgi:hypothetical protein